MMGDSTMNKSRGNKFFTSVKSSITRKLVLSYLIIVLIPLLFSSIYIMQSSQANIRKEYLGVIDNQLIQLRREMTDRINMCKQNAGFVNKDTRMINLILNSNFSDYILIDSIMNDIVPKLRAIGGYNQFIHTLRIIHGNAQIPNVFDCLFYENDFTNGKWGKMAESLYESGTLKYGASVVIPMDIEPVYLKTKLMPKPVFVIYSPIYTVYLDQIIGMVELTMLQETIFEPLDKVTSFTFDNIAVLSNNGGLLYRKYEGTELPIDQIISLPNLSKSAIEGHQVYMIKEYVGELDCWLVGYIDSRKLDMEAKDYVPFVLIFIIGMVALGFIAIILSRIVLGKLLKLSSVMNQVKKGAMDSRIVIESQDEIGQLSMNFNDMLDEIHSLLIRLEKANNAEKEAIYKALENQVNPHFLCNALEMIRMTAVLHDDDEVANATELLTNYLMFNIKRKERFVSIKDEMKNVTDYLGIYNLIKNKNITVGIHIAESLTARLESYRVLRFILQPVVENAIKHGFRDMTEGCFININIDLIEGMLLISIEDNGTGMDEERARGLISYIDPNNHDIRFETSGSGVGLRNVNERLILNYGESHKLDIETIPACGTKVVIRIPADQGGI
jgi:two-component system, sensor histidine kinase YesM